MLFYCQLLKRFKMKFIILGNNYPSSRANNFHPFVIGHVVPKLLFIVPSYVKWSPKMSQRLG